MPRLHGKGVRIVAFLCLGLVAPALGDGDPPKPPAPPADAPPAGGEPAAPPEAKPQYPKFLAPRFAPRPPLRNYATKDTEAAVERALGWLARTQRPDGSWQEGDAFAGWREGTTALAVLAFLGHGETETTGPHAEQVRKGLDFLRGRQDADGCIGYLGAERSSYAHAVATLALVEGAACGGSERTLGAAMRAVAYCKESQNPYLAWRYGRRNADNDISVTAWMVHALGVASACGFAKEERALEGAGAWFDKMLSLQTYVFGYQARPLGTVFEADDVHGRASYPYRGRCASVLFAWVLMGRNPGKDCFVTDVLRHVDADAGAGEKALKAEVDAAEQEFERQGRRIADGAMPGEAAYNAKDRLEDAKELQAMFDSGRVVPDGGEGVDYWVTLIAAQYSGALWKRRWTDVTKRVLPEQNCLAEGGSWKAVDPWFPGTRGETYATAMRCLTLEAPYRYARLFPNATVKTK